MSLFLCHFTVAVHDYPDRRSTQVNNIRIVEAESSAQAREKLDRSIEDGNDPYGRSRHVQEIDVHEVIG